MLRRATTAATAVLVALAAVGCGHKRDAKTTTAGESGTLVFTANGEEFVRRGLVSVDNWRITFDTVLVSLRRPRAYRVAGSVMELGEGAIPDDARGVVLDTSVIADLAAGDSTAAPVAIGGVAAAPAGTYKALRFDLVRITEGPYAGASIVLEGTAVEKGGDTIAFSVAFDPEIRATCGGYVGERMKGVLSGGDSAEVELTFHFDHLLGDRSQPDDSHINAGALGFDWIAARAEGGRVRLAPSEVAAALDEKQEARLEKILRSLPHTGEGHCHCE